MLRRILPIVAVLLAATIALAQIPAGTPITVRIGSEISSGTAKVGQSFEGTLAKDVVVGGKTVAKSGSPVRGKVTLAKSSGRLHAPGQLSIRLTSVGDARVATTSYHVQGKSHTKSNATKIGGGAAAGAIIGAIAGGGKGAAIGSVIGAGAGTAIVLSTSGDDITLPRGTVLRLELEQALDVKVPIQR
jgi:hypothetical protein